MKLFVYGFLCGTCFAATTIQSVTATATQAVVQVVTDQPGGCTYRASENANFTPLVHDINTMLFPGSNTDLRSGSLIAGNSHTFVLGLRTAQQAGDGHRYSRALQANTTHWVGVTCGSDPEATQTFKTQNPPLGQSAPEAPPFADTAFGNYSWPSIDFSDANKSYIDPMTGILIKRVTGPGWRAKHYPNNVFTRAVDLNSAWTNPSSALGWPYNGNLATYSGTSSDPLFVAVDLSIIPDYTYGALKISGWTPFNSIDDVLVRTYGIGSNPAAEHRNILVCLSNDSGATCSTNEFTVTLPTSYGTGPSVPANYPQAAWKSWATAPPFSARDWGTVLTNVTTSGNTITNTGTGSEQVFSRAWGSGCKVLVNGSETYTISALINGTSISTVETMTEHASPVSFKSMCSGVRIRKQTGTGTISLAVGYDLAASNEFRMPYVGSRNLCSPIEVSVSVNAQGAAAPVRSARLCVAPVANNRHVLFAFFSDNGESRLLSTFDAPQGYQYHAPDWVQYDANYPSATAYSGGNVWDPESGRRFYTYMSYGTPRHTSLIRVDYTGNFAAYNPGYVLGSWPDDHLIYTGLGWASEGAALDQLTAAFGNPNYDPAIYNTWIFNGLTDDGHAIWLVVEKQDDPAITVMQDIATGGVTSVTDDITAYPLRFFGNHGIQAMAGRAQTSGNILGNKGVGTNRFLGGPFILTPTQILKDGMWTSNTSLTAGYAETCPGTISPKWQEFGASGVRCILIRTLQPCSGNAGTAEKAKYPCPWDPAKSMASGLAPGDRFWVGAPCNGSCSGSPETMRVVTMPVATGVTGEVEFWALRGSERFANIGGAYDGSGNPGNSPAPHANGWSAAMIPPEARTVSTVWIHGDGSAHADTYNIGATHADVGQGYSGTPNVTTIGAGTTFTSYGVRWNQPLSTQIGKSPDYDINQYGRFSGKNLGGGAMESYISMRQKTAPDKDLRWFLDLRHISPFTGSGQEVFATVGTISASLVSGTSGVFKFTNYPGNRSDIKRFPPLAYAGRYLLHDMSGAATGNRITDSTPWAYCFVYKAGECRSGSTVGEAYLSVPKADTGGVTANSCIGGWYATVNPCVLIPYVMQSWAIQVDASRAPADDNYWRKLTMGFSGPGRQYQFGNITPTPDGTWAFMQGYWLDGVRNEILAVKLPPLPDADSVNHADFIPLQVSAWGGGVAARARFGYAENGRPDDYFCTSRREACVTDSASTPFAFAQSDSLSPVPCANGCTITVPAISGRVLYYTLEYLDSTGAVVGQSEPGILLGTQAPLNRRR